jgi:hypothetical protein
MQALALTSRRGDGHLWVIAFALSLLANLVLLAVIGLAALESTEFRKKHLAAAPPPPPPETVAKIFPIPAAGETEPMPAPAPEKRFARTSPDQAAPPPENTAFIGERDTRATSDRAPLADAPPLPSQAGIDPRDELDIETTESDYQDGTLSPQPPSLPEPETTAAAEALPQTPAQTLQPQPAASLPPPREALLDGPNPVDVQVPRETAASEEIKPTPEPRPAAENLPPTPPAVAETPKPTPPKDPAFSGFQRKTAVVGSISRTGRSALDVADSPRSAATRPPSAAPSNRNGSATACATGISSRRDF